MTLIQISNGHVKGFIYLIINEGVRYVIAGSRENAKDTYIYRSGILK